MQFNEFLAKYNGKYVDWDGVYGPQCVDLMRQYILEVLALPNDSVKPVVGAKDVYNKFDNIVDNNFFEKIPNTLVAIPEEGDIVLWGNSTYGHVAICIEGAGQNTFRSFDQNYPTGSPCHVQEHNYTSVLGWIRAKDGSLQKELDKCRTERDRNWNWFVGLCDLMDVGHSFDVAEQEVRKLVNMEDVVIQKEKELEEQRRINEETQKELSSVKEQVSTLSGGISEALEANEKQKQEMAKTMFALEDYQKQIKTLEEKCKELEEVQPVEQLNGWELLKKGIIKLLKGG